MNDASLQRAERISQLNSRSFLALLSNKYLKLTLSLLFYCLGKILHPISSDPDSEIAPLQEYLKRLLALNTRYILDSNHFEEPYWSGLSYHLNRAIQENPNAILWESKDSRVIDPWVLLGGLSRACNRIPSFPLEPYAFMI